MAQSRLFDYPVAATLFCHRQRRRIVEIVIARSFTELKGSFLNEFKRPFTTYVFENHDGTGRSDVRVGLDGVANGG